MLSKHVVNLLQVLLMTLVSLSIRAERPGKLHRRCDDPSLTVLWGRDVGHSAFASSPVVMDIDGDGMLEVIGASVVDTLTVLHSHNGQTPPGSLWPQQLSGSAVLASPLTYDIDRNGKDDILISSSDGTIIFYNSVGELMNETMKLPSLQVEEKWWSKEVSVEKQNVHSYILDESLSDGQVREGYIAVNPHILATPIIVDLNGDSIIEELIIPTSYFLDPDVTRENISTEEQEMYDKYLAGSLVLLNLTNMEIIRTIHLELTEVDSEYPGYLLSSPTVIDLDSNGSDMEIIIGTSAGDIHVVDLLGIERKGFPIPRESTQCQVVIDDINQDGRLEIIVMDTGNNVAAFHPDGSILWETELTGACAGIRMGDVNGDELIDVVVSTDNGHIWALNGKTGVVLENWPFRIGKKLTCPPLLAHITDRDEVDVAALPDDAHMHILSKNVQCRRAVDLGEISLAPLVSHDLDPQAPGLELLVATVDGMLVCLGQRLEGEEIFSPGDMRRAVLDGFHSELRSPNGFTFYNSQLGIYIERQSENLIDVVGGSFSLDFEIVDNTLIAPNNVPYKVNLYFGSVLLSKQTFAHAGTYSLVIKSPPNPRQGILKIILINHHSQIFQDSIAVRFNMTFQQDLKWVLLSPFLAMVVILLLLFGYPAADLLPVSISGKDR